MSARRGRGSIRYSDRHSDEDLTPTRQEIEGSFRHTDETPNCQSDKWNEPPSLVWLTLDACLSDSLSGGFNPPFVWLTWIKKLDCVSVCNCLPRPNWNILYGVSSENRLPNTQTTFWEAVRMGCTFYRKLPTPGSYIEWCQYMPPSLPDITVKIYQSEGKSDQHTKLHHFSYTTLSKLQHILYALCHGK